MIRKYLATKLPNAKGDPDAYAEGGLVYPSWDNPNYVKLAGLLGKPNLEKCFSTMW